MKKNVFMLLSLILLLLLILPAGALAAELSEVTATLDDSKWVTVSGYISSGSGQAVSVKITDPEGDMEYIGSTVSDKWSWFRFYYFMENTTAGRYEVTVNAVGISAPETTYFEYGMNNQLKALTVSKGSLSPAFSPETTEYAITVGAFTESIILTPTAVDSEGMIKINGAVVTSGSGSAPLSLSEGSNTIEVTVTAQNGDTRTYIITVVREVITDTTLTANASIDKEKNVTVSGRVSSGTGQIVPVRITAPDGSIEYIGTVTSGGDNSFRLSYNMSNETPGRYMVNVGALGAAIPGEAYFDYGSNAALKNLALSQGRLNPDFNPETTTYTVRYEGASLTVTPTADDEKAKIEVNGSEVISGSPSAPIDIIPGENTITVKVTARDGKNTKEYVLTVNKTEVSVLSVTAEIDDSKQVSISGSGVAAGKKVAVMVTDPDGKLDYLDTGDSSDKGLFQFTYLLENTTLGEYQVAVGAQNAKEKAYASFILRSRNANLKALSISDGALAPSFDPEKTVYSASVENYVSQLYVTPTADDAKAEIKVNGKTVLSGARSSAIKLAPGEDTIISIDVAAENRTVVKTYTITVSRKPVIEKVRPWRGNADLSSLTVSAGSLDPRFFSDGSFFTLKVANNVSEITVTPTAVEANATVTVNGKAVNSGSASDGINIQVGINTLLVKVTAQRGAERTYILEVIRAMSNNADLSALSVSNGTLDPAFMASTLNYTVSVPSNVTSIQVSTTTADAAATVKVNGFDVSADGVSTTIFLEMGEKVISVDVKAQDGTVKTYKITVTREASANADLSGISLSSGSITGFDPDTLAYTVDVPNSVSKIWVTTSAADSTATIKVNGSNAPSQIDLAAGENTITIVVTAQNGINTKTYTITVKRAYDVTLSAVQLKSDAAPGGILVEKVDALNYTASVHNGVSSVTVTPYKAAAEAADIQVNGTVVTRGTPSEPIGLNVGPNTIYVTVTAPDNTSNTYTIAVTRAPLYSAELSAMTVSAGILDPVFNPANINYTVEVTSHTDSITVTPTTLDPGATMTVKRTGGTVVSGSGGAYTVDNLAFGTNWVIITVTAQNGTNTKIYNIRVERLYSYDATLSALTVSSGALSPQFDPSVTNYTVDVANSVSSITVTPTANDIHYYSLRVDGAEVTSGSASNPISLPVGSKTIVIRVWPQIGSYKDYSVTVIRAPSDNANLSALAVSAGSLDPGFSAGTTSYAVSVDYGTTKLKVTPTVADSTATVKVNGKAVASGSASEDISLSIGANAINVTVTAQNGNVKTYVLTVTRIVSTNADLSGIALSTGSLNEAFNKDVTAYTMNVTNSVTSLTVTPTVADSTAAVTVNGGASSQTIQLAVGANTVNINVTAQDEKTVKTYKLTVTRAKSNNADLSGITLSTGSLNETFEADVTTYTMNVANAVTSLTVTPMAADTTAMIRVNGTEVASGSPSGSISLTVGDNIITVTVTAEDGTEQEYEITVTRAQSGNANLSSLIVGGESIILSDGTTSYSLNVANETETVTVTPTAADPTAKKIEVNGTEVASGSASGSISFYVGSNTVTVRVTAQNDTVKEYEITVNRAKSGNANLSGLIVGGQIVSLSDGTTSYSLNVANETETVTVTPTAADPTAKKIEVNGTEVVSGSASGSISLHVGNNAVTVRVTAQNDTVKTYTISVMRAKSGNAYLNDLLLKDGETDMTLTPGFDCGTLAYTLDVENNVNSLTVTPNRADPTASVAVKRNGTPVSDSGGVYTVSLAVYNNEIEVEVTAENETKKTYTVSVYRAPSDNADLASLNVNGWTLSPAFDKDRSTYTLTVGSSTDRIVVHAEAAESNSSIKINGLSTLGWADIDLTGQDTAEITIVVTAQDGTARKTYTIEVSRSSAYSDASLSNLSFDFYYHDEIMDVYESRPGGWLIPTGTDGNGFTPEHYIYKCNIEDLNNWTDLTVTPTAASDDVRSIQVTFRGAGDAEISSGEVESGSATGYIRTEELMTVEVEVTALDGTKAVYTVTVVGLNNADLSGLTVSSGSMTPPFSASEEFYTVEVASDTEIITVTPTTFDSNATVTVNDILVDSGSISEEIILNTDEDTQINVVVTARNGVTLKYYVLTVTRKASENAGLSGILFSTDSLNETYAGDVTERSEFEENQPSQYKVEVDSQITGGIIQADQATAVSGTTVNLTIIPEEGWQLKDGTLKYNDGTADHDITGESFPMPSADVTVMAEFEQKTAELLYDLMQLQEPNP